MNIGQISLIVRCAFNLRVLGCQNSASTPALFASANSTERAPHREDEPLCLAWGFEAGVQQAPMSWRVSRLRLLGWDWGLQNPCKDQHSREARSPPRCPLLTRCCWLLRCIRDKLWMLSRSTCRKTKRRSRVTAPPADKALNLLEGGLQSTEASAMESNSKKKRKSPSPS